MKKRWVVRRGVIDSPTRGPETLARCDAFFKGLLLLTLLMEKNGRKIPRYWGRNDLGPVPDKCSR
jgi:hypothetical protein